MEYMDWSQAVLLGLYIAPFLGFVTGVLLYWEDQYAPKDEE